MGLLIRIYRQYIHDGKITDAWRIARILERLEHPPASVQGGLDPLIPWRDQAEGPAIHEDCNWSYKENLD